MRAVDGLFSIMGSLTATTPIIPTYGYKLVAAYPHDAASFTQGLFFEKHSSTLLESTGLYGASRVRRVQPSTGRVVSEERLPDHWFGEGLTVCDGRCLQLLWREGLCLERCPETLALRRTLPLPPTMREGWGLTHDGQGSLFASSGTDTIHVLSSDTLQVQRTFTVRAAGRPVRNVNDLQWIDGELFANLWCEDRLAIIDPRNGDVRAYVDLSGLLSPAERQSLGSVTGSAREEVLNGIAVDDSGALYVTGKCWPRLFHIEIVE